MPIYKKFVLIRGPIRGNSCNSWTNMWTKNPFFVPSPNRPPPSSSPTPQISPAAPNLTFLSPLRHPQSAYPPPSAYNTSDPLPLIPFRPLCALHDVHRGRSGHCCRPRTRVRLTFAREKRDAKLVRREPDGCRIIGKSGV